MLETSRRALLILIEASEPDTGDAMPQRKTPLDIDLEVYKWRHLIENFFCKLKEFKRIAMRSDKTDTSFEAMIHLSAALINSR